MISLLEGQGVLRGEWQGGSKFSCRCDLVLSSKLIYSLGTVEGTILN